MLRGHLVLLMTPQAPLIADMGFPEIADPFLEAPVILEQDYGLCGQKECDPMFGNTHVSFKRLRPTSLRGTRHTSQTPPAP